MAKKSWLGVAFALAILAGFVSGLMAERFLFRSGPPKPDQPLKIERSPDQRRKEAFAQYLDGKTIDLQGVTHTIKKEEVESAAFPSTMAKVTGEPWRPDVKLILNTGSDRFFVRCVVPYHDIEDSFVFLGFEVIEVAKQ